MACQHGPNAKGQSLNPQHPPRPIPPQQPHASRKTPLGPYFCDFVARTIKLVIEIDGGQHGDAVDEVRTRFLEARGYRVIRFWNNDVLGNLDGVIAEIERVLADRPSPNPSRKREGDG